MADMRKLQFNKPTFNKDLNLTVRDGLKWQDSIGEAVEVWDNFNDELVGTAFIEGTFTCGIGEIPETFLKFEHDKACRKLGGLWEVMEKTYNKAFTYADKVTLLFFRMYK